MFKLLGFVLIIILVMAFVGFAIVLNVVRGIFTRGGGKRTTAYRPDRNGTRGEAGRTRRTTVSDDGTVAVEEGELHINRKKIFGKDEGEYVSYEEV